ncbi:universal stress protein [Sporobolomyces koalae]|uniref:universal stress protein n=1 Tax=Sporobolomyces koalae TaxID=500713 RepID=UPI00317F325C
MSQATSNGPPPIGAPVRPLVDRRRSSSRERGVLHRQSSSQSSNGLPDGFNHTLRSALKWTPSPTSQQQQAQQEIRIEPPTPAASSPVQETPPAGIDDSPRGRRSSEGAVREARKSLSDVSLTPESREMEPNPSYRRRVGFDTFGAGTDLEGKAKATGGGTGVTYSFTVSAKSAQFARTRWSRTFLVCTDLNEYSVNAVNWLLTSLAEDNDEVVVLRVIEPGSSAHNAWKASMEEAREEAEDVLEDLMQRNADQKSMSLVVEFAIGEIEETIHRMIEIYKPDSLIVGTRGRPDSLLKSAFMGSISRWAVARSPVPVVVVRPDDKVRESLERRLQDSKRGRSYVSLLSPEERERFLATSGAFGAALERTSTAPAAGDRDDENQGGRVEFNESGSKSGKKEDAKKKKKDKGKEFKRFGTFS